MPADVEVRTRADVDLSNALVVLGAPTIGHVGTITAQYLVDALEMERVGGVASDALPPITVVRGGRSALPFRIFVTETSCGLGLECERLVVVTGAVIPAGPAIHRVARALVAWAKGLGADAMVLPDGLVVQDRDEGDALHGVSSTDRGLEFIAKAGIEPLAEGLLIGLSAAVLNEAEHQDLDALCILAESNPELPDARAAARIVEVLDRVVPDVKIGTAPLLEQAEAIEENLRAFLEEMRGRAEAAGGTPRDPMIL